MGCSSSPFLHRPNTGPKEAAHGTLGETLTKHTETKRVIKETKRNVEHWMVRKRAEKQTEIRRKILNRDGNDLIKYGDTEVRSTPREMRSKRFNSGTKNRFHSGGKMTETEMPSEEGRK